jgi:chaperonin GroEL (HSP60 family)
MNSGKDPFEIIPRLRNAHVAGLGNEGFDCNCNSIVDVVEMGILDGYSAKKQAIVIASEMVRQLVRVDDLIIVNSREVREKKTEGRRSKQTKRNEEIRRYFKANEDRLFAP